MVFRKPYAFLIKYFKAINIFLALLMVLFYIMINKMYQFLSSYFGKGYYPQIYEALDNYFNWWMVVVAVLIVSIAILIISLFRKKNKPIKFYLVITLLYLSEFFFIFLGYNALDSIVRNTMSVRSLGIAKDLLMFGVYVPLPVILITFFRGLGFNIKQFNFQKDLEELEIDERDNEEFEVDLQLDTDSVLARANRKLRFAKYIYLENKYLFWGLGVIIVFVTSLLIYVNVKVVNKVYNENEVFKTDAGLEVEVLNSYQTKVNNNNAIIDNDKFYVILSMNIKNVSKSNCILPYNYLYLRVSEYEKFLPNNKKYKELAEVGRPYYKDEIIIPQETKNIVLIYEIDNKYYNNTKTFEYLNSIDNKEENELFFDYFKINLNVKEYGKPKEIGKFGYQEEVSFDDSLLKGTKLKISDVSFDDSFIYKYKVTINNQEKEYSKIIKPEHDNYNSKVIMKFKADIKKDALLNEYVYDKFFERFGQIRYYKDGKEYIQDEKVYDLLSNSEDGYYYLEVFKNVLDSDKVYLDMVMRDKKYSYLVYDKTIMNDENKDIENKEGEKK